jgi:glyoxylase-like metal-dependent hydrolase (beta-lactamase superfamily II)
MAEPSPIDVLHLGRDRVICCWRIGDVIVDPGPESSLGTLIDALGDEPPRAVLLTHIHLDHAGGTGALLRRWPETKVYVHERGARHMIDPSKLVASAGQLYGDEMDRLWGDVVPVPPEQVRPLSGGEEVLGFRVAYTPGHASHHVSFLHAESGHAFTGDTAGVLIPPTGLIVPPTPLPDIDVELWNDSLDAIAAWDPTAIGITHFGEIADVAQHLERMREALAKHAELARTVGAEEFERRLRERIGRAAPDEDTRASITQAARPDLQWPGLNRYWEKRRERRR